MKIHQNLTVFEEEQKKHLAASSYHLLGMVAQAQREFEEVRKNYNKALEIFIEFDDRYSQEIVLGRLKRLEYQNT